MNDKRHQNKANEKAAGVAHKDFFVGGKVVAQKGDEHTYHANADAQEGPVVEVVKNETKSNKIKSTQRRGQAVDAVDEVKGIDKENDHRVRKWHHQKW